MEPIRYAPQGFLCGLSLFNDADLGAQALSWLAQTANVRRHRTTAGVRRMHFERDERILLRPLALRPYRSLVTAASKPNRSRPKAWCRSLRW